MIGLFSGAPDTVSLDGNVEECGMGRVSLICKSRSLGLR